MDNLTHSLIGLLAGETACRVFRACNSTLPEPTRRGLTLTLMVVGSNLPDADFLYAGLTGNKLDYLLHHRGHTHTLVGVLGAALLMYAVSLAWLRWRQLVPSSWDRRWLLSVALAAPLLHLLMDGANNYGVHPFWPFYNGWLYGDSIFIIEPLFWIACAAPLLFLLRSPVAKGLMVLVLLLGIGLSFGTGFVPRPMAVFLTLLAMALLMLASRVPPRATALAGVSVCVGIIMLFSIASRQAGKQVRSLALREFPDETLLDAVLTPMPVNPVCWEAVMAQQNGDHYTLRRAMLSLTPDLLPAGDCPSRGLEEPTTAPLIPVVAANGGAVQWHGELTIDNGALALLAEQRCEVASFLRFARMPWVARGRDGWVIGDLRFDREAELGFTELILAADQENCPAMVPPWIPPRQDLLEDIEIPGMEEPRQVSS